MINMLNVAFDCLLPVISALPILPRRLESRRRAVLTELIGS